MTDLKALREPHLHLRFQTVPTADTRGTSAILEFQGARYLVGNVHEGLARSFSVQRHSLAKVNDVFLTGKNTWDHLGGLIGLILTMADSRASQQLEAKATGDPNTPRSRIRIYGGKNLTYILATSRKFIFRQDCLIDIYETRKDPAAGEVLEPMWCDENVQAWPLPIEPEEQRNEPESTQNGTSNPVQSGMPNAMEGVIPTSVSPSKRKHDDIIETDMTFEQNSGNGQPLASTHTEKQPDISMDHGDNGDKTSPNDLAFPGAKATDGEQEVMMLKSIVSEMFESDWRLDALFERPLSEADPLGAMFMKNPETGALEKYKGPEPGMGLPSPDTKVWVRKPWPGALIKELPKPKKSEMAMSYIFKDYPRRGKIDNAKVKASGVRGRAVGELSEGKSVTTAEGKVVTPEEVLGDVMPACGFAFVDLPSKNYVSGLVRRPEWRNAEVMDGISVIIWNLGRGVTQSPELQSFVQEFSHLQHVISSPDHCPDSLAFEGAAVMTIGRNQVDPDRYRVPIHNNSIMPLPRAFAKCSLAAAGLKVNLRKQPRLEGSPAMWTPRRLEERVMKRVKAATMKDARDVVKELSTTEAQQELRTQQLPSPDTEIVALGTGASRPSKFRGLSGTLVRVPGIGSYLLDCGENTLGQLGRIYTASELQEVLRDLKMIFISHMHADHHLGLTSVIRAWNRAVYGDLEKQKPRSQTLDGERAFDPIRDLSQGPRLVIASEPSMIEWLHEYAPVDDFGIQNLILLKAEDNFPEMPPETRIYWNGVPVGFDTSDVRLNEAMKAVTGLRRFQAAKVQHCVGAHGCSLTFPTGLKVTYSGDCRPSKRLVVVGRDSTLLIHEATFDDSEATHATEKKHSTVSEALGVGDAMGARRVVLTHVSTRYDKGIPVHALSYVAPTLEDPSADEDAQPMTDGTVGVAGAEGIAGGAAEEIKSKAFFKPSHEGYNEDLPGVQRRRPSKEMKIGLANDYMRVKLKDIMLLEKFAPVMEKLAEQSATELMRSPPPSPKRNRSPSPSAKKQSRKERLKEGSEPPTRKSSSIEQPPPSESSPSRSKRRWSRRRSKQGIPSEGESIANTAFTPNEVASIKALASPTESAASSAPESDRKSRRSRSRSRGSPPIKKDRASEDHPISKEGSIPTDGFTRRYDPSETVLPPFKTPEQIEKGPPT